MDEDRAIFSLGTDAPLLSPIQPHSKYAGGGQGGSSGAGSKGGPKLYASGPGDDMSKSNGLGADTGADTGPAGQGVGGMGMGEIPQGPTDSGSSTPGGGDVAYDWKQYTDGKGKAATAASPARSPLPLCPPASSAGPPPPSPPLLA